jgi:prevent-host-death family protein
MKELDVFTARDLRLRSGELLRDAEEGQIALITKHGRPAFLAIPFDDRLLKHGLGRALALHLFEAGHVTLGRGAKLANLSVEDFIELLGETGIDAVDYPPAELEAEVEAAG